MALWAPCLLIYDRDLQYMGGFWLLINMDMASIDNDAPWFSGLIFTPIEGDIWRPCQDLAIACNFFGLWRLKFPPWHTAIPTKFGWRENEMDAHFQSFSTVDLFSFLNYWSMSLNSGQVIALYNMYPHKNIWQNLQYNTLPIIDKNHLNLTLSNLMKNLF